MKSSCNKTKKVSADEEAHKNIESDFDDNRLYHIYNMSLEETKEKLEWRTRAFGCEHGNTYDIEN